MAVELLRREFMVDAPLDHAWRTFADVATWPDWAPHLREVRVTPPGPIGPTSSGTLSFRPLGRSGFHMSSYDEGVSWEWVGAVMGLEIRYDHRFTTDEDRTRMTWTVSEDGPSRSVRGRIFGPVYARMVDRAIPRLQAQLKSAQTGG